MSVTLPAHAEGDRFRTPDSERLEPEWHFLHVSGRSGETTIGDDGQAEYGYPRALAKLPLCPRRALRVSGLYGIFG